MSTKEKDEVTTIKKPEVETRSQKGRRQGAHIFEGMKRTYCTPQ